MAYLCLEERLRCCCSKKTMLWDNSCTFSWSFFSDSFKLIFSYCRTGIVCSWLVYYLIYYLRRFKVAFKEYFYYSRWPIFTSKEEILSASSAYFSSLAWSWPWRKSIVSEATSARLISYRFSASHLLSLSCISALVLRCCRSWLSWRCSNSWHSRSNSYFWEIFVAFS